MSMSPRRFLLVFAALASLASVGRAQLLTADTLTGFDAATAWTNGLALNSGVGLTQTFTNISSIEEATFRFIVQGSPTFGATNLTAYFSFWSLNDAVAQIDPGSTTISLAADTGWISDSGYLYYDATMDLSSYASSLNPAITYGLTFVGDATTAGAGILIAGASTPYADGSTFTNPAVSSFIDLTGGGAFLSGNDFAFTAGALSPVPEASTVTVLIAAIFVAGLVAYRIRQRRQQTAVVVEA
jgi:hypothetical protein